MKKRSPSIVPADYSSSFNRIIFDAVGENRTVLDVGCWEGGLGRALVTNKKCIVDGIDFEKKVLEKAQKNGYRKTFLVDLNAHPEGLKTIKQKYDVIVCADILEHLIDPYTILKKLRDLLDKDGRIIISLPNVAFGLNRIQLFLGNWDYTEYGTLDKTHLRFFTARSLHQMVDEAGLIVDTFRPYNQFGLLSKVYPLDQIWPNFFCYQFMIIVKKP